MQVVILAAGKSTRTYPLTLTKPKQLLKVANKTILEYNLEAIKGIANEIIIVLGYKKDTIKKCVSEIYPDLNIKYVEQRNQRGTGHALLILERHIKDKFILMLGDNIYSQNDITRITNYEYSILVQKVNNPENYGVVIEEDNIIQDIIEKPKEFISELIISGLYFLDKKIFTFLRQTKKSERGEYELTDALKLLAKQDKIHCIKSKLCFQISYPWDLLKADSILRRNKNNIGKNSKIYGKVKNSTIGNNCIIEGNVKDSIIMDNTVIDKTSIVEDSVIGEKVYFKGSSKSSKNITSIVKGKKIIADKLGTIIGDNVNAEDVNINAGCKIWPNKKISGSIIKDIN